MKWSVLLAIAGLGSGIVSGVYWIRAARVPFHEPDIQPSILPPGLPPVAPLPIEPRDPTMKPISLGGLGRYAGKSGDLNWRAAAWSIAGVISSSASSLLSAAGY